MTWLVACEESGAVRDALRAAGVDAVSCDLLPTAAPGPHIQGDVEPLLQYRWAGVIAHPPCTRLANSGVRWLEERNLWPDLVEAARFFRACLAANAPRVAVENPTMHGFARRLVGRGPDCAVHPWQFGEPESKRTCFWLKGLEPLRPEVTVKPANVGQSAWRASPGPERSRFRSRTPAGLARAIAEQWGGVQP